MGALDMLRDWPVEPGAAGVLVQKAGIVEVAETFGDLDAVSEWASVTKPLVALAVLVEVQSGTFDLDDPLGPPGSTVRHLLSHASGLAPDRAEPLTAPERRRIYSNAGFEVLARYLAEQTGRTWQEAVAGSVTVPAGMAYTTVPAGGSPASGAVGPLADLMVLGRELLAPTILSASSLEDAASVAFPGLPGVVPGIGRYDDCSWGLGFEVKGSKRPHWTATRGSARTFGHFGRSGAFIWVDPDAGVALATAGGGPFGSWAIEKWPQLSDAVLDAWADPRLEPGHGLRGS